MPQRSKATPMPTGEALYAHRAIREGSPDRPGVAEARACSFLPGDARGGWDLARGAAGIPLSADDDHAAFPHHRDSWISAAATEAGRVLALTRVLPVGSAPGKPAIARQAPPIRTPKAEQEIDFARQIKPLLERSCACGCHGRVKSRVRPSSRIDGRDAILKGGASGEAAIVPGHSEESPLIDYVSGHVPGSEMPPKAQRTRFPALRTDDVALLRAWIDRGAGVAEGRVALFAQRTRNDGDPLS